VLAELSANRRYLPIDARLDLAVKKGIELTLVGGHTPSPLPGRGQGPMRALGRGFFCRRTNQVPHHLPADRRVRIEEPRYDRPSVFGACRFSSLIAIVGPS
jgi:hypothetical protein